MSTYTRFYGGATARAIAANASVFELYRVQVFFPTVTNLEITLPDARHLRLGGVQYYLVNADSAGKNIVLKDNAGTTLATITDAEVATLGLITNATAAGTWTVRLDALGSIPAPPTQFYGYFCGGEAAGPSTVGTVHEYHASADTWTSKTAMTDARKDGFGMPINNLGYMGGGVSSPESTNFEQYTRGTDTWAAKLDTLTAANAACGCEFPSTVKGYRLAGTNPNDNQNDEYDPGGNTWTARTDCPSDAHMSTAQHINAKIYLANGDSAGTANGVTQELTPTSTWVSKATQPTPALSQRGSFQLDDKMYVVCGLLNAGAGVEDNNYQYDPGANTWATKTAYPGADRYGCLELTIDDKGYVIAGEDVTTAHTGDNEEYEHIGETWTTKTALPVGRSNAQNNGFTLTS